MAITPKTGFGSIPPTLLAGATDVLQHIINSAIGSRVGITHLSFSAMQAAGAVAADGELVIPFYVLRGTIGGTPPQPSFGTEPYGIPGFTRIAQSGYELLDCGLFRLSNSCMPITYERGHLECMGNQQLVVISTLLLDGTTLVPVEDGSMNTQTVLGYDASSSQDFKLR